MPCAWYQNSLKVLEMPLHLQASSQFTDSAAAAGLRALEKRVEAVPVAVYEFLQAGGVPAAITIITSEPVHMELREAAISLLIAVARKQPQALSLAFVEAKGMEAVAHLIGQGVQLRAGALTQQGAATVAAAARLLEAALEAGVQPAARAFADAGGFAALRMGIACAQLSSQLGLEVAERALGLLHRLVWAGNKSHAGPPHAALCSAVCSARAHQPVLALVYANPHIPAAAKGIEVLRTLAAATPACMRALLQANCVDTCLTVLDRADSNSNSKVARTAALLLHDALDWDPVCRADVLAKGGVATFLNVLVRDETDGAPIADVISGLLNALAEGSADITQQEGKLALHWAAQFGEMEILHKLMNGRQNLRAVDGRGNSALHLAAAAGQMDTAKLLLEAGADVRARNFAGDQPHQLTVQGNPLWETLIAELDWRACLEQPRLCQFAAAAGDASCSGQEEAWQGPADCSFLPLTGRVRIESAGIPSSSKHWFMSAIKGGRSRTAQEESRNAQQSSGGCVERLVIRADLLPGQRAPDLARALRTLLHRCYPGAVLQVDAAGSGDGGLAESSKAPQRASASYELSGDVPGRQEAAADLSSPVQEGLPRNEKPSVASIEAKPSGRPICADSAVQRRPSSALEIARRLRRAPAAGSRLQEEGQGSPSQQKPASGPAARTPPLMSYLPLAESQRKGIRPKAPPPPPPPPPLLRSYGPAAVVDATATAAAVRAGDDIRRQQETLGRGKLYAPTTQSVADKVRELELQIGLVQQLNSQGLRKDETAAETSEHVAKTGSAPVPPLPAGGPSRLLSSGGTFLPEEDTALAAQSADDKAAEARHRSDYGAKRWRRWRRWD
ncbi:hypothetical protein WJX75_005082 [Coccomyxa subellipsoidea]|uniref:Ankyrin n=1 Tax=Coccomyxa subellipsoidea TaxID=248742 RepID=A0ABR2YMS4_9CHLO